jgi:hypothetical protein
MDSEDTFDPLYRPNQLQIPVPMITEPAPA